MNTGDTHIRDIRICQAVSTLSRPIADATHDISKIAFYVLEVETAAGVTGQGYLLSFPLQSQRHRGRAAGHEKVCVGTGLPDL
ncbi:MAG: hypothetical protein ACLR0U_20745 [Enterocloster clostridioformis]